MTSFSLPVVPRYAEVDQQGVVFNGHYFTWFDEACTGFLDHLGVTYPGLIDSGHDIQVVHCEIDFVADADDGAVGPDVQPKATAPANPSSLTRQLMALQTPEAT